MHLVDQGSHAVDAGITRRDDDYGLVLLRKGECEFGTFPFFLHARIDAFAPFGDIRFDKLEIILIPHDGICLTYCLEYGGGDVFLAARSDACYDYFSHIAYKDSTILLNRQIISI